MTAASILAVAVPALILLAFIAVVIWAGWHPVRFSLVRMTGYRSSAWRLVRRRIVRYRNNR